MIWGARGLSFCMGFLSLSQEILWVRMASFIYRGAPQAFGVILALYLLGIALGAGMGKRYCVRDEVGARDGKLFHIGGVILLLAAVADAVFPWLATEAYGVGRATGAVLLMLCVFLTALLKSMIFPIAHHLGSSAESAKVGSSVSKVYFANIAGATLGPLVTGFVLLHTLSLQQCFALMAGLTLMTAAWCRRLAGGRLATPTISGAALAALLLVWLTPGVLMGRLIDHTGNHQGSFKAALENRYGVIHLLNAGDGGGDYVFGGNAYDGRINTDFMADSNWISRVYMLAAVQPRPRRVLVLGMSAGSWTRVLTAFPGVEKIDVLEINPGYVDIASRYPEVRGFLSDPRVSLHFDDGRRWLKRHPDQRYDLIVMNTTFHFRAYVSLLLSKEFLTVARRHLLPGGVMAFNSTYSPDVYKTAAVVFPSVYKYGNFAVVGDAIAVPSMDEGLRRLAALRWPQGAALIDVGRPDVQLRVQRNLALFQPYDEAVLAGLAGRPIEVITDQNMLTEYKHGESVLAYLRHK